MRGECWASFATALFMRTITAKARWECDNWQQGSLGRLVAMCSCTHGAARSCLFVYRKAGGNGTDVDRVTR